MFLNTTSIVIAIFVLLSGCVTSSTVQLENPYPIKTISFSQKSSDDELASDVVRQLEGRSQWFVNQRSSFEIKAFNNVILVVARVPNENILGIIEEGVSHDAYNTDISIGPPRTWASSASDSTLATQIKSSLILSGIDASIVNITVFSGSAYLMGFVDSNQRDFISDVVSRVSGVNKVVDLFEVIDS